MSVKLTVINKINSLIKELKLGNNITDEEKAFLKQELDENLEDIQENHSICANLHLLLIAIGDKEFAEHIFRKELKSGFEIEDGTNYERGTGITAAYTFKEFGDKEYLKKILFDKSFFFTGYQKQKLIEEIGDKELIKRFIDDSSLGLGSLYRQNLIELMYMDNPEKLRQYLFDTSLNIDSLTKAEWVIQIGDDELTEKFIRDTSLGLNSKDRAKLIIKRLGGDVNKINEYLTDEALGLDSSAKTYLLGRIASLDGTKKELLEEYVRNPSLGIDLKGKTELISIICDGDSKKLADFIMDKSINLDSKCIMKLLSGRNDKEEVKKILKLPNLNLSTLERVKVARNIKDWDYVKELVEQETDVDKKIQMLNEIYDNEDLIVEFLRKYKSNMENRNVWSLVTSIHTPEKIEEFIEPMKKQNAEVFYIEKAIRKINNPELIKKWSEECLEIKDLSELTLEQLEQNENIKYIILNSGGSLKLEGYTRKQYIEVRKAANRVIDEVKKPKKDDFKSELEAFKIIFKRLSHIQYDEYAVTDEGSRDESLSVRCRNLYNGLVEGKCVCVGYSQILKECLNLVGIESKVVYGNREGEDIIGHQWNQVKIGGVWFNCDLTNYNFLGIENNGKDAHLALKSSEEFKSCEKYSVDRSRGEEKCDVKIQEMILRSYMENVAHLFGINEIKETFKRLQEKIKLFKNRLLHKDKEGRNTEKDKEEEK